MFDYSNQLLELSPEDKKLLTETIDLTFENIKKGKETLCPKCGTRVEIIRGLVLHDPRETKCKCGFCVYREIPIIKPFANGNRKWNYELTDADKDFILKEAKRLNIDSSYIEFVSKEHKTAYLPKKDIIQISGNVFPDNEYGNCIQDELSVACVLAHEYYGHKTRRIQYIKEDLNEVEKMNYNLDEAIASRNAARYTPNLTNEEKIMLYRHSLYHIYGGNVKQILSDNELKYVNGLSNELIIDFNNKIPTDEEVLEIYVNNVGDNNYKYIVNPKQNMSVQDIKNSLKSDNDINNIKNIVNSNKKEI